MAVPATPVPLALAKWHGKQLATLQTFHPRDCFRSSFLWWKLHTWRKIPTKSHWLHCQAHTTLAHSSNNIWFISMPLRTFWILFIQQSYWLFHLIVCTKTTHTRKLATWCYSSPLEPWGAVLRLQGVPVFPFLLVLVPFREGAQRWSSLLPFSTPGSHPYAKEIKSTATSIDVYVHMQVRPHTPSKPMTIIWYQ